jgi:hypothetical protein
VAHRANPGHPAVDWSTLVESTVVVTCPRCHVRRREAAKSVRYRISVGRFTGLCVEDARRELSARSSRPPHPAVDWGTLKLGGPARVQVTCPVCRSPRWLEAKTVRKQIADRRFTGACAADRFTASGPRSTWPRAEGVDWGDYEMVVEEGTRRRRMIRVRCPQCEAVQLRQPSHLAESIRAGRFRPECSRHRVDPRLSARARAELLQLVRLVDQTIEDLAFLRGLVRGPSAARGAAARGVQRGTAPPARGRVDFSA